MDPAAKNSTPDPDYRVNLFQPRRGFMRREVRFIWLMLGGWTLLTFGFPLYLVWLQRDPSGASALTETTLLGFPFHYWFSGQFLILWFIILCFLFNILVDRLIERYRHPHHPGGRHVH